MTGVVLPAIAAVLNKFCCAPLVYCQLQQTPSGYEQFQLKSNEHIHTIKTLIEAERTMDFISTLTFDSALILSQLLCSLYKLLLQVQLIPGFFGRH